MVMERMDWLDGMRGILCLWIVLFHYTCRFTSIFGIDLGFSFDNGKVGVAFFFIISGFLMQATAYKFYERGAIKWFWGKWKRLFFPYVLACFFIYFMACFGVGERVDLNGINFIKSLLMVPWVSPLLDGAHWYVFSLIRFYILFMVMLRFRLNEKTWFLGIPLILCVVHGLLKLKYGNSILGYIIPSIVEIRIFVGVMLFNAIKTKKKADIALVCFAILFVAYTNHWLYVPLFSVMFFLLVVKKCSAMTKILSCKFLVVLGSFSYELYLIHQNVGYGVILFLIEKNILPVYVLPYLVCLAMCVVAFLMHHGVEKISCMTKKCCL